MRFFAPNIDRKGRIIRGVLGVLLVAVGLSVHGYSLWVCLALVLSGGFSLFQAARGWCFARACGIKTKV